MPTLEEITARSQEKKAEFLKIYATNGNKSKSCREVGLDKKQITRWLEHDEQFSFEFQSAKEDFVEALEEEARRRAADGCEQRKPVYYKGEEVGEVVTREYSDTLLVFLLKALKPEKYKDRVDLTTTTIVKAYAGVDVDAV